MSTQFLLLWAWASCCLLAPPSAQCLMQKLIFEFSPLQLQCHSLILTELHKKIVDAAQAELMQKKWKKNSCQVLRDTIVRSIRSACYVVVKGARRAWWWCSCYARISTKMVFLRMRFGESFVAKNCQSFIRFFLRFCNSQTNVLVMYLGSYI